MAREAGLGGRASFVQADASQPLPFEDGSFDAILCIDAMNHLPDRPGVLSDWARLLRPDGRLLFTDPVTVTGILDSDEIAIRTSIGYFLFVPPGEDERLLAEAGLSVLAVEDTTRAWPTSRVEEATLAQSTRGSSGRWRETRRSKVGSDFSRLLRRLRVNADSRVLSMSPEGRTQPNASASPDPGCRGVTRRRRTPSGSRPRTRARACSGAGDTPPGRSRTLRRGPARPRCAGRRAARS